MKVSMHLEMTDAHDTYYSSIHMYYGVLETQFSVFSKALGGLIPVDRMGQGKIH